MAKHHPPRRQHTKADAPSVLRRIALALSLARLPRGSACALALDADGGNQALDVGALGDGLALLLELAGDHVLAHVVLLQRQTLGGDGRVAEHRRRIGNSMSNGENVIISDS